MCVCASLCVICLVKDSGQQGTGWVQGSEEEDYGLQFLWLGVRVGGLLVCT